LALNIQIFLKEINKLLSNLLIISKKSKSYKEVWKLKENKNKVIWTNIMKKD